MKLKLFFGILLFSLTFAALSAVEPAIIPQPQQLTRFDGAFALSPRLRIYTDQASTKTGQFLVERLRPATGYELKVSGNIKPATALKDGILLTTNQADATLGPEGYELTVATNHVVIRAATQAGLFYGVQTLLQLLPPEIFSANVVAKVDWEAPCVHIKDWPRFPWRGLLLDVSRHFFTKAEVEKMLDAMALLKLNTFHWHLVDDGGWRIEIKKYPKLTSVGAWREGVGFGLASNSTTAYGPDGRYGGFYSQDDIREVVAYAAARHIDVVPEIEMPGHSLAALTAYPQFGAGTNRFTLQMEAGGHWGIYSPAKDGTFVFLENILTEVFQLFPSKYIHVGGDEVPPEIWPNDPDCRALMQREGLKTSDDLQAWFMRRIEHFVNANNKTIVGWSEIARGGLAPNAVVMDWIGGGRETAMAGHDVVMTPSAYCYLDFFQSPDRADEPLTGSWCQYLPLAKTYAFEPVPADLPPEWQKHILGGQGNLWTEFIPNLQHAEYMAFPRLTALAEVLWSAKDTRNFHDFNRRLQTENRRFDLLDLKYRSENGSGYKPSVAK